MPINNDSEAIRIGEETLQIILGFIYASPAFRNYARSMEIAGHDPLDTRDEFENNIMRLLRNIEHHDLVGNNKSYELYSEFLADQLSFVQSYA